jgi:hypothetical protein
LIDAPGRTFVHADERAHRLQRRGKAGALEIVRTAEPTVSPR